MIATTRAICSHKEIQNSTENDAVIGLMKSPIERLWAATTYCDYSSHSDEIFTNADVMFSTAHIHCRWNSSDKRAEAVNSIENDRKLYHFAENYVSKWFISASQTLNLAFNDNLWERCDVVGRTHSFRLHFCVTFVDCVRRTTSQSLGWISSRASTSA